MMLITFVDGLLFSFLSVSVVILIIFIIVIVISPLKKLSPQNITKSTKSPSKITIDEDMMVAVLIASIDFRDTTEKEPKLISVKEINL